jgi:hypothetical protein
MFKKNRPLSLVKEEFSFWCYNIQCLKWVQTSLFDVIIQKVSLAPKNITYYFHSSFYVILNKRTGWFLQRTAFFLILCIHRNIPQNSKIRRHWTKCQNNTNGPSPWPSRRHAWASKWRILFPAHSMQQCPPPAQAGVGPGHLCPLLFFLSFLFYLLVQQFENSKIWVFFKCEHF